MWPWSDISGPSEGTSCTLERGDALFLPHGYHYASHGEDDVNLFFGWQGDTRNSIESASILSAISMGDVLSFEKAFGALPEDTGRKQHLTACVNHAMNTGHIPILKALRWMGASFDDEIPSGATHLHTAASAGQAESIRFAIEDGADPSVKHAKDGQYAIHNAVHAGHSEVVGVFLDKARGSWKRKDIQGRQPLHIAAMHGHTAVASALVKGRAKVDAQDKKKFQPLHWAAEGGQPDMISYLLSARASIEAKSSEEETALYRAAVQASTSCMAKLLDARADIHTRRTGGQTPLHATAYIGHLSSLEYLHSRGAWLEPEILGGEYSPESLAASAGHNEVLEYIQKEKEKSGKKVDVQAQKSKLRAAVQAGHVEMLEALFDREPGIGPPEQRRAELAGMAAQQGHLPVLKALLRHINEPTILQNVLDNLVYPSAKQGHSAMIAHLAKRRASVNGVDQKGEKPLALAAGEGHAEVVEKLLSLRADADHQNEHNITALQMAVISGKDAVVTAMLTGGTALDPELETRRGHLHAAAHAGHIPVAKALLQSRVSPMQGDAMGIIPSFIAAEQGHVAMMKLLVENRADPAHRVLKTNGPGEDNYQVEASAQGIAGMNGHIRMLAHLAKDNPIEENFKLLKQWGDKHGVEWQEKLKDALGMKERMKKMEAMRDPETVQRMQAIGAKLDQLPPAERARALEGLHAQAEQEEAKQKSEEKARGRRFAEL